MRFYIITLFPESFPSYFASSIIGRAMEAKKISVRFYNPRAFTRDPHRKVDDKPYGGGPGMVLRPEPVVKAYEKARRDIARRKNPGKTKTILFSARGKEFTSTYAKRLEHTFENLILIAGHYEGVDARVKKITRAEELSIGPYILTGGELPAMVVVDAVTRFVPGALGKAASLEDTRTASADVYTRPRTYVHKGKRYRVPDVLASGDHEKIEAWRREY